PTGEFFVQHILTALQNATTVICLITPTYLERPFCLAELGAAQQRNVTTPGLLQALIVKPTSKPDAAQGVLYGTQVADANHINPLRTRLRPLATTARTPDDWDKHYPTYNTALEKTTTRYDAAQTLNQLHLINLERKEDKNPKTVFKNKLYLTFENRGT